MLSAIYLPRLGCENGLLDAVFSQQCTKRKLRLSGLLSWLPRPFYTISGVRSAKNFIFGVHVVLVVVPARLLVPDASF